MNQQKKHQLLSFQGNKLYEGCLLAAVAHAVTAGEYPELNFEHSWDGMTYCMNDAQGCRGCITFTKTRIVGAFCEESKVTGVSAISYFEKASDDILQLAREETLQYLLDDLNGSVQPVITAAFWGSYEQLYSNLSQAALFANGASLMETQLLDEEAALLSWDAYYECHDGQLDLIKSLYHQLLHQAQRPVILSKEQQRCLYGERSECEESLLELQVRLAS